MFKIRLQLIETGGTVETSFTETILKDKIVAFDDNIPIWDAVWPILQLLEDVELKGENEIRAYLTRHIFNENENVLEVTLISNGFFIHQRRFSFGDPALETYVNDWDYKGKIRPDGGL